MAETPLSPIDHDVIVRLLKPPAGNCDVVIDTDTYNEIDDQFAIVQALLADNLNVEGIFAAPFHNKRSTGPADGMENSYHEILRVLNKSPLSFDGVVTRGSTEWMSAPDRPVDNPATNALLEASVKEREGPLYVLTLGAVTNVASAIVTDPTIRERAVVVALGATPYHYPDWYDFNLRQDLIATRTVFDSGMPVVHVPGWNVSELMFTSEAEVEQHVKSKGAIGDYLYDIFVEYVPNLPGHAKQLWDMSVIAYAMNPNWTRHRLTPSPIFNNNFTYSFDWNRHPVRVLEWVDRNAIMCDFIKRLDAAV